MSEEKYIRETRDGREVLVYPDGTVKDARTGYFLRPPNAALITKETSPAMIEHRRQLAQIAQLRGLARGAGMDLTDKDLEEIAKGAGDAIENMTAHFYQVFMKSTNVRGLAEAFRGLTAPLLGEPEEIRKTINYHELEISTSTMELLKSLREAQIQIIDTQVVDP